MTATVYTQDEVDQKIAGLRLDLAAARALISDLEAKVAAFDVPPAVPPPVDPPPVVVPPYPTVFAHGREVTATNVGHLAYVDPKLGRKITDADLAVWSGGAISSRYKAGDTVSKVWFKSPPVIDIAVTFVACRFDGDVSFGAPGTLEWCTVDGKGGEECVRWERYTARFCKLTGSSDGPRASTAGQVVVDSCWIRTRGSDPAAHIDGHQNYGAKGPVTITRCNIDARPVNGVGSVNAALFCADAATGIQTWTDNYLAGGGFTMRLYDAGGYVVTGNDVLDGSYSYAPAHLVEVGFKRADVVWSNNRRVNAKGELVASIPKP